MKEHYARILEVSPLASKREIKQAYRKKALQLHPDVNQSDSASNDFIALKEAFEALYFNRYPKRKVANTSPPNSKKSEGVKDFKSQGAKFYSYSQYHAYAQRYERAQHQPPKPKEDESLTKLGLKVSLAFYYVIRAGAFFMFSLPIVALFFRYEVFFSVSTLVSLGLGWFFFRYSSDWKRDLNQQLARQNHVFKS